MQSIFDYGVKILTLFVVVCSTSVSACLAQDEISFTSGGGVSIFANLFPLPNEQLSKPAPEGLADTVTLSLDRDTGQATLSAQMTLAWSISPSGSGFAMITGSGKVVGPSAYAEGVGTFNASISFDDELPRKITIRENDNAPVVHEAVPSFNVTARGDLFVDGCGCADVFPANSVKWKVENSPVPGETKQYPNYSGDGNDSSDTNTRDKWEQHGDNITSDDLNSNARPEDHTGAELAAHIAGFGRSRYSHYHYFAPVFTDDYGSWVDQSLLETYIPTYFGDPEVEDTSEQAVTGYLFIKTGGADFSSLIIPDALAGGDEAFQVFYEQQSYDLNAGEVFDFESETGTRYVDSFILTGIDQSEMISAQSAVPFVFGLTNSTEQQRYTQFVAIPLVPPDGDINNDGQVNGSDLLAWQRGETFSPLSPAELAAWQANYGAAGSQAASKSVPEPSTVCLITLGLFTIARGRVQVGK